MPEGVPIRVMTSQSMVLSGEGAKVSEITPRKSDSPFFIFSVAPEEPSVCREKPTEEVSGSGAGFDLGYGVERGEASGVKVYCVGAPGKCSQLFTPFLGLETETGAARVPTSQMGIQIRAAVGLCRSEQSSLAGCFTKISRPVKLIKD